MDRNERKLQRDFRSGKIGEAEYTSRAIRFLRNRGELPREVVGAIAVTELGVLYFADRWRLVMAAPSGKD